MSDLESIFKKLDMVRDGFEILQYGLHGPVDVKIFWRSEKDENGIDLRCVEARGTTLLEAATEAYSQYRIKSYKPKHDKGFRVTCAVHRMLKSRKIDGQCAAELLNKRAKTPKDTAVATVELWTRNLFKGASA